ncbi:hypothetical protein VTK26DRAFT_3170 [Humicola hyalothermophila]
MRSQPLSILLLLLGGLANATPLAARQAATSTAAAVCARNSGTPGTGGDIDMVAAILAIMPTSKSCSGSDTRPEDCRTAEEAAPFVAKAHADLTPAESAALLALMALESVEFKYKHNISPGRAGQGTANMMMPEFVKEYATDLFGAEQVAGKGPAEVLEMVTPDEHNFASAAWFYTKYCSDKQESLKTGTDAGWMDYMACIGVDGANPERMEYWNRAKQAFNL